MASSLLIKGNDFLNLGAMVYFYVLLLFDFY
jgi:hypothetical protein